MLKFRSAGCKWWNKPLVLFKGRPLPAELAILSLEMGSDELGAWLNSRGTKSGVVDLLTAELDSSYRTQRIQLPAFVSSILANLYDVAQVAKGCPDLVIWNPLASVVRLVEVKCPHWDKPSAEQEQFLCTAKSVGVNAKIVEWELSIGKST